MKAVISSLTLASFASALTTNYGSSSPETLKDLFEEFKREHGRSYSTMEEEMSRFGTFVSNLKMIDDRNHDETNFGGSAVHGITRFADLSQEEFEKIYLDRTIGDKIRNSGATVVSAPRYIRGATAVDYSPTQTTAIKDQGSCGSCWAHAAAQQIESDGMRLLGNPSSLKLSVQQLVSCDHGEGQLGCMGGLQETGFDYVRTNGGIVTESDYPYSSYYGRTGKCDTSKTNYVMGVNGYEMIRLGSAAETENGFTSYMLSTGTISIGVDATTWNTYKSGVMSDCGKGTDINHAVQLVGVDTGSGKFWKIRNSWSAGWGEAGNIRIKYGVNTCGLATEGGSYVSVFNK